MVLNVLNKPVEDSSASSDKHVSQHLLSLLHKQLANDVEEITTGHRQQLRVGVGFTSHVHVFAIKVWVLAWHLVAGSCSLSALVLLWSGE